MAYSTEFKRYCMGIKNKDRDVEAAFEDGINLHTSDISKNDLAGAYLRGAFIACGSITDPEKHYFLSFTADEQQLDNIKQMLELVDIIPSDGVRKGQPILYLRDSTKIEDFLSVIGATVYTLRLMEIKVSKEMNAGENRKSNAYCANYDKTVSASAIQIKAIRWLKKHKHYELLSDELKKTASLRERFPDLSLDELRQKFEPPLTKSGLNHRLKKVIQIYNECNNNVKEIK